MNKLFLLQDALPPSQDTEWLCQKMKHGGPPANTNDDYKLEQIKSCLNHGVVLEWEKHMAHPPAPKPPKTPYGFGFDDEYGTDYGEYNGEPFY